jgi:hypothetical protein
MSHVSKFDPSRHKKPHVTKLRCPECDRKHHHDPDSEHEFFARIVSDADVEHPDVHTHTLKLECIMCGSEMGFAVNLAPSFDDVHFQQFYDTLEDVQNK